MAREKGYRLLSQLFFDENDLTALEDLPCLPQGPSADSCHAGLERKRGAASLGGRGGLAAAELHREP